MSKTRKKKLWGMKSVQSHDNTLTLLKKGKEGALPASLWNVTFEDSLFLVFPFCPLGALGVVLSLYQVLAVWICFCGKQPCGLPLCYLNYVADVWIL